MAKEPVQILRAHDLKYTSGPIWIIFDRTHVMKFPRSVSKKLAQYRWTTKHGQPEAGWEQYAGTARPSEAAVTISSYQHPMEKPKYGNQV